MGMPLQQLDLHSARTTSSTISNAVPIPYDMSINNHQPSQDGQGVDFEQNAAPDSNIKNGIDVTAQAGEDAAPQPPAYLHSYPDTYTTASTIDSNQPDIVMENQSNPSIGCCTVTVNARLFRFCSGLWCVFGCG